MPETAPFRTLEALLLARRSRRSFAPGPLLQSELESVLRCGHGQSGEDRRVVPSAGALDPMRLFAVCGTVEGREPGLHDLTDESGLGTCLQAGDLRGPLEDAVHEAQPWIAAAPALIVIAADIATAQAAFRDQQPDGHRGQRYAAMEAGAIAQSLYLAVEAAGLAGVLVAGIDDTATAAVLKLPGEMIPLALFALGRRAVT